MSEQIGDYGFVVQALLQYLNGKGQVYSGAQVASILVLDKYVRERYRIDLHLREFVRDWIELSEIEQARWETVAQKNAEIVTKVGGQINYVEQKQGFTKLVPFGGRKKKQ